tara:strand:+ start:249 stop:1052 length:804 start_codon:yes stop_codon:yes gene_type:complete
MVKNTINEEWTKYIQKKIKNNVPLYTLEKILIKQNYSIDIIYNLLYKNKNIKKNKKSDKYNKNYLCDDPIIFTISNFLSNEECKLFIDLGKKNLKKAGVGLNKISDGRTGSNKWISHDFNDLTQKIANRISELVNIPLDNAESFQIIHYSKNQKYRKHYDSYLHNKSENTLKRMKYGGQRIWTCLCYLNDVDEGGQTKFVKLNKEIYPKKGTLLVFKNTIENTNIRHPMTLHSGMPIIKGEKYAFTIWFRECSRKKLYKDFNPLYYV